MRIPPRLGLSPIAARDRNDLNDVGDVWEVAVSAHNESILQGDEQGGDITKTFIERSASNIFLIQRFSNAGVEGNIETGDQGDNRTFSQGVGETSERTYHRTISGVAAGQRIVEDSREARGSLDTTPPSANFSFDKQTGKTSFSANGRFVGRFSSRNRIVSHDPDAENKSADGGPCDWSVNFGIPSDSKEYHCQRTKSGFVVNWLAVDEKTVNGTVRKVTRRGSASIRRYIKHEPVKLIVSAPGFADWLPAAKESEKVPGNQIKFAATVNTDNGKPLPVDQHADSIRFELVDTSRLPGVCMNWPAGVKQEGDHDLDLQFIAAKDSKMTLKPDAQPQQAQTPEGVDGLTEASATVASYDWGASAKLLVIADLADGEVLVGQLEGQSDRLPILLPLRSKESKIADSWKTLHHVDAAAKDIDDVDEIPKSSVLDGDGLSLFEEYRGFYENGKHVCGDPHVKDLFVLDKYPNKKAKPGLACLARISDMTVHHQILPGEVRADRVINFNFELATHAVDQHALVLELDTSGVDSISRGKLRCPSEAESIMVAPESGNGRSPDQLLLALEVTVAHELLHGCGVDHHGKDDPGFVRWEKRGKGQFWEQKLRQLVINGKDAGWGNDGISEQIVIADEAGKALTDDEIVRAMKLPQVIYLARETHGICSGVESCVMRYECANACLRGDKRIFLPDLEPILKGTLCNDPAGTGINANTADHISRHGDSVSKIGCKGQICVNDKRVDK